MSKSVRHRRDSEAPLPGSQNQMSGLLTTFAKGAQTALYNAKIVITFFY
jgi:hypothetical protein